MRLAVGVCAMLLALVLAGCVAVKEPVGTSVGYVNDPALEGTWRGKSDKDRAEGYYHVILNADATLTVVGFAPKNGDDKASWGTLTLTTVTLGANHYMNVRETGEDGGPPKDKIAGQSIPLLYRIEGDRLALFTLDEKKVTAAIRAGKIEGTITPNKVGAMSFDSVAITADGPHLDAYLKQADAPDLFEPVMEMHR
ncbi:MAG: hypothetical protein WDM86_07610 [Rhizomicrobium sp.]